MEGRDCEIYFSEYKDHVKEIVKNYLEKTWFYSVGIDTILVNDERYCVNVGCFGLDALIAWR